ncbi:MAG TPA: response regulator [Terriglobales bacterium]|jgi:CheY-like chemotaxis protein
MASLKLLVVEDNIANLELMTEIFTSLEAQVRAVSDSEKAAFLVSQEKFDGIFLDLEMPHLNGFELSQLIRESSWNKATPIVIVTGRDERDTMKRAFSTGATFYLQKPIDRQKLNTLFRTVRGSFLENRRRSARVPLQTEVNCSAGERNLHGRTWNLSQGGMQVEVNGLKPGESVRLSFQLPSSRTNIEASATVVWGNQDRQGMRFTQLTSQNQEYLRQFISQVERS